MDRVVLGKAAANSLVTYTRSGKSGLFISAPGANVHNCADGDLIFDSTSPGIVQILGRGRALVPKQVYDKGLYGEEGVITESNWNSVDRSIPRELNPKTSWVFDAILQVSSESKKIKANWNTSTAYSKISPPNTQSDIYIGTPREDALNNSMWKIPGLGVYDNELAIRDMIKKMWRITTVFPFLRDLVWTIKGGDNSFISKGLQSHLLRNDVNPDDATTWWATNLSPRRIPSPPHYLFNGVWSGSGNEALINRNNISETLPGLNQAELPKLPTGDYDLIPAEWMAAWNAHADRIEIRPGREPLVGSVYPTSTAFTGRAIVSGQPKIWRALTTAGEPYDEDSLKHDFIQMLSIFAWSHENFGKFLETTNNVDVDFYDPENYGTPTGAPFDYEGRGRTTASAGTKRIFDFILEPFSDPADPAGPKYHFDTGHLDAKEFTDFNTTSNWGYTQWRNGEVVISTGVDAPEGVPVQVWWNSISRPAGNTSTNLSFLDIRDHFAKQSTSSERLTALKPGISSVSADTYIQNNEVKLRITQPSTEDTSDVYYTVFKESAVPTPGEIAAGQEFFKTYNTTFVLNITDINDPTFPGDNHAGRRQSVAVDWDGSTRTDYGRYYSVVFPDDFVKTKFSLDDPFRDYRDSTGRISSGFAVTLNIPEGVELSGNGHGNYVLPDEVLGADRYYGANEYGPKDTYGRPSWDRSGMIDPCIKLNLASTEWTDGALQDLLIRIENNGVLIGAGGYGQYGQSTPLNTKQVQNSARPGGGGGGGAGYHPELKTENPTVDWLGAANNFIHPTLGDYDDIRNLGITGRIDDHRNSDGSTIELDMHRGAISTHWQGPNNYVEWGIGRTNEIANHYTGMDKITMDSLGPGKPGTGYLGMAGQGTNLGITYTRSYTQSMALLLSPRPYYDTLLEMTDSFGRYDKDLYERLPGTYYGETGLPRGGFMYQRGFEGLAGTKTSGGGGGAAGDSPITGTPQDTINQITWTAEGVSQLTWHNGLIVGDSSGQPGAGHGGSLVYLYANTASVGLIGTTVRLINNVTGRMKSGGGGGSAGSDTSGLAGGNLGRPGGLPVGTVGSLSDLLGKDASIPTAENKGNYWDKHSRRGEPGKLIWWNSDNLTSNYSIENNSQSIDNSIEGLEYNTDIQGWDYVSYSPNIVATTPTNPAWFLSGLRFWSRYIDSKSGRVFYTAMGEQSFADYFNQIGGTLP